MAMTLIPLAMILSKDMPALDYQTGSGLILATCTSLSDFVLLAATYLAIFKLDFFHIGSIDECCRSADSKP